MRPWFHLILSGLVMIGVGCGDEPPVLYIVVDTDISVPEDFSSIRVSIAGSRTEEGHFCEPATHLFRDVTQEGFPIRVGIETGGEYSTWMAIRVAGVLDEEEVVFREIRVPCPPAGVREVGVFLENECLDFNCYQREQCYEGTCVSRPDRGVFEGESLIDRGTPCDRSASVDEE